MLRFIGVVQFLFGLLFTLAPTAAGALLGLTPATPAWVAWLFVMMGARFLGYGFGMFVAARDPIANQSQIPMCEPCTVIVNRASLVRKASSAFFRSEISTAKAVKV